ncbi:uncharacterized protein [Hetaerina americana]
MRLPLRPAPAPPKATTNGSASRPGTRPPLQRRLTNVGIDWDNPWGETEVNHNASDVSSITHSMSDLQLGDNQDPNIRKKRTPPPRPPPPRFNRNIRSQNNGSSLRNSQKSSSSSILAAIFNNRRPARKGPKEGGNGQTTNGRLERHMNSSRRDRNNMQREANPQHNNRARQNGSKSIAGEIMKNSVSAPSMLNENHRKAESPPPLLDLLTSSPPSSPVPSSRFGGSSGADTDSLSSDGFSKVGMRNFSTPAFPSDDDPFDPFGDIVNGTTPLSDPWGVDDAFSPVPAPRNIQMSTTVEDPWANNYATQSAQVPSSSVTQSTSSSLTSSSISAFNDQEEWVDSQQRNFTVNAIGSSVWYTSNSSSLQTELNSSTRPSGRNFNSSNVNSSSRPTPCEVPRTMNLAILGAMPTIIRAKPKPKERNLLEGVSLGVEGAGASPPMPSVPPPPPPPSDLLDDWNGGVEAEDPPDLPPRPWKSEQKTINSVTSGEARTSKEQPHGVALFDYPATHADDLAFQTGEVILLLRKINDEWYYGQREIGGSPGMFPSTFIRLVIGLSPEKSDNPARDTWDDLGVPDTSYNQNHGDRSRLVKALYTFKPETSEDLEFEEGATIEVTAQLDSEWLWGHIGDKWGQFPASFVDRIPKFLPQHQL